MILPMQVFTREWIKSGVMGNILNIASMTSYKGLSGTWAYNAAKSAVMNLTSGTSREFAKHNIRVNSISPGFFVGKQNHDLLISQDEPLVLTDRGSKIIDRTPMGRFGNFNDLKGAVLFLCSNAAAAFVTGIDIPVDGGFLTDNI
jgi:NAD(P)-dependent dehydrogenase (short-subunit alcohol dehydrogenase family)